MNQYQWINSEEQLSVLVNVSLKKSSKIAFDTEFVTESFYFPKLCLLQIHSEACDTVFLIDVLSGLKMDLLSEIFFNSKIEKVFHSPKHDLSILEMYFQKNIENIFDTQLAASFLGYGDQVSLKKLLKVLLNIEHLKNYQYSDWAKRPLSEEQIQYAVTDVCFLMKISDLLKEQLKEKGRYHWFQEESKQLQILRENHSNEILVSKIKGRKWLKTSQLPLLKKLVEIREQFSIEENKPREYYLTDFHLVQLVLQNKEFNDKVNEYLQNLDLPLRLKTDIMHVLNEFSIETAQSNEFNGMKLNDVMKKLADTIFQYMREFAEIEKISLPLLVTRSEINRFVRWKVQGIGAQQKNIRFLDGWRYQLFGKEIIEKFEIVLQKLMSRG